MTTREVIDRLKSEGITVKLYRIEYVISQGHVPAPPKDYSGRRNYSESDYSAIKAYLAARQPASVPQVA